MMKSVKSMILTGMVLVSGGMLASCGTKDTKNTDTAKKENQISLMAESIQGSLEQNFKGLKINVRSLPTEAALNMARESDYDLFLIYWTPDYQDAISTLNMLHSENELHYNNPTYDKMLDEASTTLVLEPEKRWQKMIEAEKEVIEKTAGTIVISQNQ